jgi:hypothetical protein
VGAISACVLIPAAAWAQTLAVEQLGNGTELIHVAYPLSGATSVSWPESGDSAPGGIRTVVGGSLTLNADLEQALDGAVTAPPVVVAVGGSAGSELRALVGRLLADLPPHLPVLATPRPVAEGGVERRLGVPGEEALLRLVIALPSPHDHRRAAVEVLWEILPELLDLTGLASRVEGGFGVLEARVDAELAELRLRSLRLALARVAGDPRISEERVEAMRRRLVVRRQAQLEAHPQASQTMLELWLEGRTVAIREFLFGLEGVTPEAVRSAAAEWLPQHPGAAVLVLPPTVLNPRFAPGPELAQLDNDLATAVLERPGTPLAALCLQPVLLPDIDGQVTATVLTRLAAEVRATDAAPGWVRVRASPAALELAAPSDAFAELCEVLQVALQRIGGDERPLAGGGDARRRALDLMAAVVGLAVERELSPADLLRPGNLAVGVVAPDGEAATEAMSKFLGAWAVPERRLEGRSLASGQRSREAVAGRLSAAAVALPLPATADACRAVVVAEIIHSRVEHGLSDARVEVLSPLLPGRRTLVLLVSAEMALDELEEELAKGWGTWMAPVEEGELVDIRRRVAARASAAASGALGRARTCAAVAAGEAPWRPPRELELTLLTLDAEEISALVEGLADLDELRTTGAGVLPIVRPED